jgi:ABC-type multidrug transport system fused ATPase/permease subunit
MSKPVEQDVEGGEVGGEAPLFCPSNSAAPAPALPGKAITVTFQQLTFEVDQGRGAARKRRRAPLLQDVAGFVLPGQLTAVLGPSGSGAVQCRTGLGAETAARELLASRKQQ